MKPSYGIWAAACLLVVYITFGVAQPPGTSSAPRTPVQKQTAPRFVLGEGVWYGDAKVKVTVSADGTFKYNVIEPVTITSMTPPTNGPNGPEDPPPEVDVFRDTVEQLTEEVVDSNKENTKKALSKLFLAVGTLPAKNTNQLIEATNIMFKALSLPNSWQEWKNAVDALVAGYDVDKMKAAWTIVSEVLGD